MGTAQLKVKLLAMTPDPDKLTAGNYSIKQVSTEEGLEPVITNDSFAILENGNPNQTHSWTVQNEANAGNVTIRLWTKQGIGNNYNWVQLPNEYTNLKPGRTYYFTVSSLNSAGYPDHYWYNLEERESNHYRIISNNVYACTHNTDELIKLKTKT